MANKPFKIERADLVNNYSTELFRMINFDVVRRDIIKGSEFIVTAQDILDKLEYVSGHLVGLPHINKVPASKVEIIYNKN